MNTTPRTRSKDPPRWYACHKCGTIHHTGIFTCTCGYVRNHWKPVGLDARAEIGAAWKAGKSEAWISQKFDCSNKTAREFIPLSMRKRNVRVMK